MTALALEKAKYSYYLRFNENHDENGRFASSDSSGGSGGSWSGKLESEQSNFNAMRDNKKALYLYKNGYMSKEDSLAHMKDGTIGQYGDEYFSIMRENGSYEPTGAVRDNSNRAEQYVRDGKAKNYDEARLQLIKEDTGFSDAEAEQTFDEMKTWFGGSWSNANTEVLDKYVDNSPAFDGTIHRGLHFENDSEFDAFMNNMQAGDRISMGKNASWTDDEETARGFAHSGDDSYSSAVITCLHNKTSSPVADLSFQGENEVLSSSKAQWTVLRTDVHTLSNGQKKAQIYVVEADR